MLPLWGRAAACTSWRAAPGHLVSARHHTSTSTSTSSTRPPPPPPLLSATAITYHRGAKVLEVELSDEGGDHKETHRFSAELLRVASPSIDNRAWAALARDGGGQQQQQPSGPLGRVPAGRRGVGIRRIDPVGNYAVRITFDDFPPHQSGLYTWDYLRLLSSRRRAVVREYLAALRGLGRSRRGPPPLQARRRLRET